MEGKIIPAILFIALLEGAGTAPALVGTLAFSMAAVVRRVVRKKQMSGILVLTTVGLLARTVAALATGSLIIYFFQPVAATALVGLTFLGSVLIGSPLAARLLYDLCPVDDDARSHPLLGRVLAHVSLWWAFTSAINFSITLWVLLNHSPTTFVIVKSMLGPATTTFTLAIAFLWFRALMARAGTQIVFAPATTLSGRVARTPSTK